MNIKLLISRSSAYLNPQLVLNKWNSGIDLNLLKVGEFTLLSANATQLNLTHIFDVALDGPSSHIRIRMRVRRRITFYISKIVLPYFVFYVVIAFTYALPVEAGEKKSYSTSILISAMIYLKDISCFIPKTSILPLLTIYFNLNLVLVFFCIALNTLVYMFYYYGKLKVPMPRLFRRLISNTSYIKHERQFAANNKLFCSNEIKSNLTQINKQLAKVTHPIFKFIDIGR